MNQLALQMVVGRLVLDAAFRADVWNDPQAACRRHGFDLLPRDLAAISVIPRNAVLELAAFFRGHAGSGELLRPAQAADLRGEIK